jgi:hypothetical protein
VAVDKNPTPTKTDTTDPQGGRHELTPAETDTERPGSFTNTDTGVTTPAGEPVPPVPTNTYGPDATPLEPPPGGNHDVTPGAGDATPTAANTAERPRDHAGAKPDAPFSTVDESGPERPELPVESPRVQFPSQDGTAEGRRMEVAKRTTDAGPGEEHGERFVKVFRVGRLTPPEGDLIHTANAAQVVQEAMQRGLHARGDVYLTGAHEVDEPLNPSGVRRMQYTDLRYEVEVVPAIIDTEPTETTTPTVVYQAAVGGDGRDGTDADHVGDRG